MPTVPARTLLGQRALELPTILVTNQHSLSDAEDFTEGYRTLKLGKVVGEPTAGWIIYTGSVTLIDGSTLRMPAHEDLRERRHADGDASAPVDVPVTAAGRRELHGQGLAARHRGGGAAEADRRAGQEHRRRIRAAVKAFSRLG